MTESWLPLLRVAHVLGVIAWIGGTLSAGIIAATGKGSDAWPAARTAIVRVASPGMVLAWLAGLAMLLPNFSAVYARAGWMHGKLLIALAVAGLTGALSGRLRRAVERGDAGSIRGLRAMVGVVAAFAFLALVLLYLRPF